MLLRAMVVCPQGWGNAGVWQEEGVETGAGTYFNFGRCCCRAASDHSLCPMLLRMLHCPFESLSQRLNLTQGSKGSRNSPRPRRMTSDYQTAANL